MNGGHQSLYSLWTVKDVINFGSVESAQVFQSALKTLCLDLEGRVDGLGANRWSRLGFASANKSVPNLSRISEALAVAQEPSLETITERLSAANAVPPFTVIPTFRSPLQLGTVLKATPIDSGTMTASSAPNRIGVHFTNITCSTAFP